MTASTFLRSGSRRTYAIGISVALVLWGAELLAGPTGVRTVIAGAR